MGCAGSVGGKTEHPPDKGAHYNKEKSRLCGGVERPPDKGARYNKEKRRLRGGAEYPPKNGPDSREMTARALRRGGWEN